MWINYLIIMSITSTALLDERGNPLDPWAFGMSIQSSQTDVPYDNTHHILFNKGRYFETDVHPKELRDEVSEMCGIPVQYNTMIVGSWKQMEDFVIAMNIKGIRVKIDIDWI